ncbi:lymphocyte antigen 6F-like [Sitophilus oryzae]|uniref:Lymphocyte antigen 6F-like n=1 Tax=Sitophilus oryzae TaxID=7048 RepID=A0A6J2XJA1_SITOR|nr:lymphocyte antigen 6F-like [Sitophilus oryzae]
MIKTIIAILLLLICVNKGTALTCYSCNVSTSEQDEDACKGIGNPRPCAPNSVCLSALYELNTGTVKTFMTMKTCYPIMNGEECTNFVKTQKNMLVSTASLTSNSCKTCETDDCNRRTTLSSGSRSVFNPLFLISILGLFVLKIILS